MLEHNATVGQRIVLDLGHGQNSSVARVSVTRRAEDNGRLTKGATLTVHCTLSVPTASYASMICCSSGRETTASWNIRDTREKYNERRRG